MDISNITPWTARSWKWRHYDPSKRRKIYTQRYSATSQKTYATQKEKFWRGLVLSSQLMSYLTAMGI